MTKKRKLKHTPGRLAGPDDPIFKEGVTFYTRPSDRASTPPKKTGKFIYHGLAKFGETGQSGGAIITGGNLRRSPEKKSPPAKSKEDK